MDYRTIPNLKQKVSVIGLGTWSISGSLWGGTEEKDAIATIHRAIDLGINLIDTAPAYGSGRSEKIIGKVLKEKGKREKLLIATKCGLDANFARDSRREAIIQEVEASLQRLQTDYIDLYQIHWPDPLTSLEETAHAMDHLLKQGKIRAIGVSNYSVEQMKEFRKYGPLHSSQPPFNLFEREQENSVIAYCQKEGIATLGYSALCRGLLSEKILHRAAFSGDDVRKGMDPKFQEPRFSQYLRCVEALREWAKKSHHVSLVALAVRWVIDKKITCSLWGARLPEQLKEVPSLFGWTLSADDFKEIDQIIAKHVTDPIGPQFMAPPEREKQKA